MALFMTIYSTQNKDGGTKSLCKKYNEETEELIN